MQRRIELRDFSFVLTGTQCLIELQKVKVCDATEDYSSNAVDAIKKYPQCEDKLFHLNFSFFYHLPLLFVLEQQEERGSYKSFNGSEDGDRLTVFFNRTDSFQRTGRFFRNRILNGLFLGFPDWFFTETFPKKEEVD